jgi:hypothetical protein
VISVAESLLISHVGYYDAVMNLVLVLVYLFFTETVVWVDHEYLVDGRECCELKGCVLDPCIIFLVS